MVDLALKNLLHDKLRFAITVAGVAFSVALILVQSGLFIGILSNASIVIEHMGADLWVTSRNTPNIDFAQAFPEGLVDRVRSAPGVARADNLIVSFMNVSLPTGAQETSEIYALKDFSKWGIPWHVVKGGTINDLRRGPYIFIDNSALRRFGHFDVGDYREYLGRRLKIIGITKDALSFTTTPITFMDYDLAQSIQGSFLGGKTSYIIVKVKPGVDINAVKRELQRRLPYNDVHTSAGWAAQSKRYWVESTGIGFNMFITVFLGCLVGIVVVAQTLYTSTMEHLKEFGTVKAIGGSNRDIYRILTKQALISAVIGFVAGEIPSWALIPALKTADLKMIMPLWLHVFVFIGTLVMCLLAAIVSFRKVASIDPAMVFRT